MRSMGLPDPRLLHEATQDTSTVAHVTLELQVTGKGLQAPV